MFLDLITKLNSNLKWHNIMLKLELENNYLKQKLESSTNFILFMRSVAFNIVWEGAYILLYYRGGGIRLNSQCEECNSIMGGGVKIHSAPLIIFNAISLISYNNVLGVA